MAEIRFAFRMVHIDNIDHIVKYGFVHKDSPYASPIMCLLVMLL